MNRFQLLASASVMTLLVGPNASQAQSPEVAGSAITAIPSIQAIIGSGAPRSIAVGNEIFRNEEIVTGPQGHLHVLFRDESNMTLGPNARIVIDEYVYDPVTGTGNIAMEQTRGVMRFIGGAISKASGVTINTVTGTIGVRGGVALINVLDTGAVQVFFVFGDQITIDSINGDSALLDEVGFSVVIDPDGSIGAPQEINPDELGAAMNDLETPDGTVQEIEVPDSVLANLQDQLEESDLGGGDFEPLTVEDLEQELGTEILDEQVIQEVFDNQNEDTSSPVLSLGG